MNYYLLHIGDYSRDTAHLSLIEDGAYRRMLDICYSSERPLPTEAAAVYRLVRATSRPERKAVDVVLADFFRLYADGWHQKRVDQEIAAASAKSQKARASADRRWHGKGEGKGDAKAHANAYANAYPNADANADANAMRSQCEGNAPSTPLLQYTNHHQPSPQEETGAEMIVDKKNDEGQNPAQSGETAEYDAIATELAQHRVIVGRANTTLLGWMAEGITLTQMLDAIVIARRWKPEGQIAPGYLDRVLHNPKLKPPAEPPWWTDDNSIVAKANELNVATIGKSRDQLIRDVKVAISNKQRAA